MHVRVASLLAHEGDMKLLTGSGLHVVRHYLMHRLVNAQVMREVQRLDIEWQEMTSQRKHYCFNPMVKPFVQTGLKISTQELADQKNAQPQKLKDVTSKWIKVCKKSKSQN